MNKSYDVYMCRSGKRAETERKLADAELLRSSDDLWSCWSKKVARDGFLTYDANGELVRKKEAERHTVDAELSRSAAYYPIYNPSLSSLSPFDRMPSKIEMQGMNEIFMREYCGGIFDEK